MEVAEFSACITPRWWWWALSSSASAPLWILRFFFLGIQNQLIFLGVSELWNFMISGRRKTWRCRMNWVDYLLAWSVCELLSIFQSPCVLPLSTFTARADDTTLFFIQASHSKVTVSLKKKWGENNLIHKSNASRVKWKKKSRWLLPKKCFPCYITCCWFEMLPRRVCQIWNSVHDQSDHRKPFSTLENSYEHLLIKRRWNRSIVYWFCKKNHSWRTTCSSLWNKYKVPKYLSRIVLQSDSPNSRFACTAV